MQKKRKSTCIFYLIHTFGFTRTLVSSSVFFFFLLFSVLQQSYNKFHINSLGTKKRIYVVCVPIYLQCVEPDNNNYTELKVWNLLLSRINEIKKREPVQHHHNHLSLKYKIYTCDYDANSANRMWRAKAFISRTSTNCTYVHAIVRRIRGDKLCRNCYDKKENMKQKIIL